jgi:hypothetical protein
MAQSSMKRFLTIPACLLLALPALAQDPAPAATTESAPKLDPIIAKMIENLPKLAEMKWEAAHTLNLDGNDGGVTGSINLAFQDKKHFKCNLDLVATQKVAEGETAAEPQNIKATLVADGAWLWISSPMLLQSGMLPEHVKIELAVFDELLAMMPQMMGGMAGGPEGVQGMVTDATKGLSFKEEGSTEALKRFVFAGEGWNGAMKLDAATWFPMGVDVSNEEGMKVVMNTTSFNKKETFAEGTFALNGVDVSTVMDLSAMIRMQLGAMGGGAGGDEDLEF